MMSDQQPSRVNQVFDLLVEEIEERIRARAQPALGVVEGPVPSAVEEVPPRAERPLVEPEVPPAAAPAEPAEAEELQAEARPHPLEPEPELPPMATGPSHAVRLMVQMALGLLVAIVLINIPFNRHGTTLATAMPDSTALVMRDGLVVKEEDEEEIYVYQDGRFRWISSLDAFEHYRFTWGDVHVVENGFLDEFEKGPPLHVLLKCHSSPHIYRAEAGEKRWIRDIATFVAEGHVWEDVRFVSCGYLRGLPDGDTIPPGSGPPPQP
jgi:hypothetical protein